MAIRYSKEFLSFLCDENPLGTSKRVKNRLRKAIKNLRSYNEFPYRQFINYTKKIHDIYEENILVGNGSTHLFKKVFNLIKPKKVLFPVPIHNRYKLITLQSGIEILPFYAGTFLDKHYDLKEMKNVCDRAELIILPNPHNITGKILDIDQWYELAGLSHDWEKLIVIDESLINYTDDTVSETNKGKTSDYPSGYLLILRTFSTFYGLAGIPFGYVTGDEKIISSLKNHTGDDCFSISLLAYIGAITALKDKHFKKRTAEFLKNEKAYINDRLKSYKNVDILDPDCNFLLFKINCDENTLREELKKRKVLVDIYSVPEGLFIRFPIQKHKYNAYFVKTLKEVLDKIAGKDCLG